jgi:hypothetical protein
MCGKCSKMAARGGCVVKLMGILMMLVSAASRLWGFAICTLGPRSFAAAAIMLLLASIAINMCPMCGGACGSGGGCGCCSGEKDEHDHEHKSEEKKK